MGWGDDFLVKPGTVMMIVFIAAFGLIMFTWTSDFFETKGEKSKKDQDDLIDCSNLEIDIVDLERNESNVKAFFKSNKDVERIYVNFEGPRNVTKSVGNVAPGSLKNADSEMANVSRIYFRAEGCSKIFER